MEDKDLKVEHINEWVDLDLHPLKDTEYIRQCKLRLDTTGCLTLPNFLRESARYNLVLEAKENEHLAYYTTNSTHNVYLTPPDPTLPPDHVYNRQIISSKGCITTDQIPNTSGLKQIYGNEGFKYFLASVLGEETLYPYEDPLSSINVNYASCGQELGWHFDNSSFAITLLLQAPEDGGRFEYVPNLRDSELKDLAYTGVLAVLDGHMATRELRIDHGTLMLFRGRDAMHRVTPTIGKLTRVLVVLAYNNTPGVSLSEEARRTFFGRLG
jgi:hypothetical protein